MRFRKGFFGKTTGILFDSGPSDRPHIFLTFIKQKQDGSWEKPSNKEGKVLKFSLVDVAFIIQVLRGDKNAWETCHSFEDRKTSISFQRDSKNDEKVIIKVADYQKFLNYGEIEVFKLLLERAFEEKVFASAQVKNRVESETSETEAFLIEREELPETALEPVSMGTAVLVGTVKGETEKALLIDFEEKKEIWVPKSTIRCSFDH